MKTPRTTEEINQEYTQNCALHGHKFQLFEMAKKQMKTLEYECEELLRKGLALNKEAGEAAKRATTPIAPELSADTVTDAQVVTEAVTA